MSSGLTKEPKYPRLVKEEKLCYHPSYSTPVLATRIGWEDEYGFIAWEPGVTYVQITGSSSSVCLQDEECINHFYPERDVHSEQDRQRIDQR